MCLCAPRDSGCSRRTSAFIAPPALSVAALDGIAQMRRCEQRNSTAPAVFGVPRGAAAALSRASRSPRNARRPFVADAHENSNAFIVCLFSCMFLAWTAAGRTRRRPSRVGGGGGTALFDRVVFFCFLAARRARPHSFLNSHSNTPLLSLSCCYTRVEGLEHNSRSRLWAKNSTPLPQRQASPAAVGDEHGAPYT